MRLALTQVINNVCEKITRVHLVFNELRLRQKYMAKSYRGEQIISSGVIYRRSYNAEPIFNTSPWLSRTYTRHVP